ncbi:MAG: hypothetical protein RLZZ244_1918 [Verrucomicrobiota bacterium]
MVLAAVFLGMGSGGVEAGQWYVSLEGNDAWSGRMAERNAEGTDGPFASWERARRAVREELALGKAEPVEVRVRGGVYRLTGPLQFGAEDSGRADAPVVWKGDGAERPRVVGSVRLKGWEIWKGEIWRVSMDSWKGKPVRQVLLRGERQPMARYPDADENDPVLKGWAYADGKDWPMYSDIPGEDKKTLQVKERDVRRWAHPEDAEVTVFARYNWWNNLVPVASVEGEGRVLKLGKECSYPVRFGNRYFIQGPLEELDAPGEWHYDAREKQLYFWAPRGASPEDAEVVLADALLVANQTRFWSIEGMEWEGSSGWAVSFERAEDCRFAGNGVRNGGEWSGGGIRVSGGHRVEVRSNDVVGSGRDAVSVSGGDVATLSPSGHVVENNHVHHFGVYYKQGSGVAVGGVGNVVRRNWIHDGPRFGIHHGGNRNVLEGNHIHDVCLETEDTGAIYSGGRDWITPRGTVIRHNYIHDIWGLHLHNGEAKRPYFSWGIYLDDNSGGADVVGNLVVRAARGGLHGHGARDCVVENNVWVGNGQWQVDFHGWSTSQNFWERHLPTMIAGYEKVAGLPAWKEMRGMELHPKDAPLPGGLTMRGNRFERNILVSEDPNVPVLSILRVPLSHNSFDRNLYWAPGGVVKTGASGAGPNVGPEWLGAWVGAPGALPEGWRWQIKPEDAVGSGLTEPRADGVALRLVSTGKAVVASGADLAVEPGATYRLTARVRASREGKASVAMTSGKAGRYAWTSPRSEIKVGPDWEQAEWTFVVPLPGEAGGHAEMRAFRPRVEWKEADGWLEVAGLSLHKAEPRSEWEAWRAQGADAHSLVADPKFVDRDTWELAGDSPAWGIGFERIPMESIGTYTDAWRRPLP